MGHPVVHGQLGSGVETEPPEPEDEHADDSEADVVARNRPRLAVRSVLADPWAEEYGTHEGGPTARTVDDAGSGEVTEAGIADAQVREDPVALPEHVDHHRVDEPAHDQAEQQVGGELRALGHGTRGDGHRRGGKDHLEEEERRSGQHVAVDERLGHTREEEGVRADEAAAVRTEGEAEADGPEGQGTDRHVGQVLGHDVADVLGPGHPGLDQGEPCLHQEHEAPGQYQPEAGQQGRVVLGGSQLLSHGRGRREGDRGHYAEEAEAHLVDAAPSCPAAPQCGCRSGHASHDCPFQRWTSVRTV